MKNRGKLKWAKKLCVPAPDASGEVFTTIDVPAELVVGRHLDFFQFKWAKLTKISDLSSINKWNLDWNMPGSKTWAGQCADWRGSTAGDDQQP